jgi:DNA-directed RNA polymerase specialized sigma24 family protein
MDELTESTAAFMRERAQFEADMQAHVARLCSYAAPYVAALVPEDKEAFLETALAQAWIHREDFHPRAVSLYVWWERCLRTAALTRERWFIYDSHGRRTPVLGERLGREGAR